MRLIMSAMASACVWTEMLRICERLFGATESSDVSATAFEEGLEQMQGLTALAMHNVYIHLTMPWRRGNGSKFVDFPKLHQWRTPGWTLPSWTIREPTWEHMSTHLFDWVIEQYIESLDAFSTDPSGRVALGLEREFLTVWPESVRGGLIGETVALFEHMLQEHPDMASQIPAHLQRLLGK
jgi:hypothetical protein